MFAGILRGPEYGDVFFAHASDATIAAFHLWSSWQKAVQPRHKLLKSMDFKLPHRRGALLPSYRSRQRLPLAAQVS